MNRQGFHVAVKPVTKGHGHSIIAKAAYNSGSKITDKKSGWVHDYSAKMREKKIILVDKNGLETVREVDKNVAYSVLILPKKSGDLSVDREQFWNDIEFIEKSEKAQLGVEIDVMFPHGLNVEQRIDLVERYSQTLADRYNVLVDVNIHKPHTHLQEKGTQVIEVTTDNHHAHILLSSREIIANQDNSYALSKRKNWSLWSTSERLSKGLNGRGDELKYQRKLWADLANEVLPQNLNITEKSYREQGVNRLPTMKLGKSLYRDILKGKRSVIHEYNETIQELNRYIEDNGIEIDYNDQGRIDTDLNVQAFNGIKVVYKKRKPYASIDLNKLTLKSPKKELDHKKILDNFMAFANSIEQKKKIERSALLSRVQTIDERLSKQAERAIKLKDVYDQLPERAAALGLDWDTDFALMIERLSSIQTKEESADIKQTIQRLDDFRQDETQQTTESMTALKTHLNFIENRLEQNNTLFAKITPQHQSMIEVFNRTLALNKPFDKQRQSADKMLDKINHDVIEKEIYEQHWQNIFYELVDIKVTDNRWTYYKYKKLAYYDVDALKALEHTHMQLKTVKAAQIDDKTQQQMDTLLLSLSDYKKTTDEELAALKQQVNTSIKTYERLEPFYTQRQALLDQRAPVIEQDEDLYQEITTTKTTQLNAVRLDDWTQRVDALQAQLNFEHEQAELERQQQADRAKQAALERQAKLAREAQVAQMQAYSDNVTALQKHISVVITKLDFNALDASTHVQAGAARVVETAMMAEGLRQIECAKVAQDMAAALITDANDNATTATDHLLTQLQALTDTPQKVTLIEQMNDRFEAVLAHQPSNPYITALSPQLQQLQNTAQQSLNRTKSYSSPRP